MSRQLWPGNRGVLNYRTNVQTVVEQQSLPGERVAESSQCVKGVPLLTTPCWCAQSIEGQMTGSGLGDVAL